MNRSSIIAAFFALVFFAGQNALAQSGYDLFQKGLVKERTEGDLDEAIRLYKQIVEDHTDDRALVAKTLVQMGRCYEKLGRAEARKAYERVVSEYIDQPESVRIARRHLEQLDAGAPGAKANGPTYRLVLDSKIAGMPVNEGKSRLDFSPSGDRIVFKSQGKLYIADQTATVIRPILDDPGPWELRGSKWSPDGRLIAYKAWREVTSDSGKGTVTVWAIFIISPDGGAPRQIGPEVKRQPRIHGPFWTPDSRHLSYRTGDSDGGLHTLTLDGDEVRFIPNKDMAYKAIIPDRFIEGYYSPDGRWYVYSRTKGAAQGDDMNLYITPATGGTPRRLTHLPGYNGDVTWAPDGRTLYFVSGAHYSWPGTSNIWRLPMDPKTGLAKGEPQQVTFLKDVHIDGPKVLGDGSRIAFNIVKQNTSIQVAASSPHESHTLISGRNPQLSPDGQTIYYVSLTPGKKGIYAVLREGGTSRRLTESIPEGGHPFLRRFDLSPDGRTLAYVAQSGEGYGLFTQPASGGEPRLMVKTNVRWIVPQWSPDGSLLAYADGKDLYVISATGGKPRELAHVRRWEEWTVRWSPDGKSIAALGHLKPVSHQTILVVPASGGELRQLPCHREYKEGLEWHPDGKRLTYHASLSNSETRQAYLDGRPASLLVNAPDVWDYLGIWAPDGRRFFFVANDSVGSSCGMYVYDEASAETKLVSAHLPRRCVPCFSRDGKTMAWHETRRTNVQTWIMENFQPGRDNGKPEVTVRQVWAPALDAYAPSPDGRYLSYNNWTKVELAVHDLKTGENRDLTDEGTWNKTSEYPDRSIWSPDSRQVAYCWFKGADAELRIVDLNGSKPRVLCGSVPKEGHAPLPHGWSQDGKYILALLGKKDESLERGHEDHIVLVSVADGSLRVLKSLGERRTQHMSLSPDGRYVVFELTTEDSEKRDIYLLDADGSGEATLVEHPADDRTPFWAPDGKRIVFVSDRSGSPGVWMLDVDDGRPKGAPTLVKEMGKKFYPMGLTPDGSFYYSVGTPAFDVYAATLDFEAGKILAPPTKMSLRFEGSNYAPFWSPDGKYLAYASQRSSGRVLVIRDVESGQERDLSPKTTVLVLQRKSEATPRWSPDGASILVTAIDLNSSRRHRLNLVDAETGNVTPIVPKKEGGEHAIAKWPVFSNDGKQIYYVRGDRSIVACNLETHGERELYRTNTYIYRLALSPNGRRLAFFEAARAVRPTVVKTMPASGGEPSELYKLKEGKRFSWGVGLSWTPDGDHVVVGAPDDPDKPDELWMIPAEGGEPRKLELGVKVNHLSLHPDGRRIAFTRPEPGGGSEVWVMENFLPESTAGE